ncbi:zinc carboxypeptidase [Sphingobacterium cellulitidis]|uniref:M14 metallopeptidase family protein n=1 Tax=Sphingobacterium cellulitidis TaxID=1768011 RepID=UPI000B942F83|nr:M14 metallopeptidase family protein [Sphingobacterium cellulitidis]OYD46484.1 zinc carboxypeptidase [Sphingobacterium cellulitidis]
MKKMLAILACFISTLSFGQIKSPAEFLGYQVGSKVTPHWKVLEYYQYLANQVPNQIKMESYGETTEGRPLRVFYISSAQNIGNLENIRTNNLKLAHALEGEGNSSSPAIVWISNNIHGNETSSIEASMMTLFELVNPNNSKSKTWLENTLVIIDPCLNPDGTERYNNWYNSVVGVKYNPELYAREHREPWPGGRYNHYYFDMNRDWAWQTQRESTLRAVIYNKWLPHIHVDFHEQGINSPYYFPPAAEPLHEVITPWQREFQTTIGKHNAKYFDSKGWLYFTNERFDLFYPSYGDTYPIYSGAIGMTFEKAGNGSAGLGVYTDDKDTLTLVDRAIQHHASGLNVIEIVSQNAAKVVSEFKNFGDEAASGKLSSFQSYIIKYDNSRDKSIRALLELLDKNKINYYSSSGSVKGMDYFSKKEQNHSLTDKDVVIPGNQSKAALIRVLFEPEAKLTDSVTYDITAWSLPYVYGLPAIASQTKISNLNPYQLEKINNTTGSNFGYAIKWDGFTSAKLLAALLRNKITVKVSDQSFKIGSEDFPKGSILVMKNGNKQINTEKILKEEADRLQVKTYAIASGIVEGGKDLGSSDVKTIKAPKVMMMAGEGIRATNVGEVWHYFDQQLEYPIVLINPTDFSRVEWDEIDVFIMPNGSYSFLKDKTQSDEFSNWIKKGGKVIALESAVSQLAGQTWSGLKTVKQDSSSKTKPSPLKKYGDRERGALENYTAGAIFRVTFDASHPLMFGVKDYFTLKQDENLFQYFEPGKGWNVGYITENSKMSGFVGHSLAKKLKNGLVFGTENIGRGSVIYLTDNVLFRNFWESGKLIMANATFFGIE